ncbi:1-deoxy-D-xylulose-5-phosphate reductoisomerase [Campylobacter sp. RM9344]|uniref:1-deoxy-D-xylulose 5-phosphate reductoisomerase n=1 Tax=Campylobacter californiensis TaxID=1032243 RepID=A0AAW3ZVU9_9BACT|nr:MULTISPECIES: 1-deoxy-D-xylulose-5-phosphate reductoisomerase [unclassified Campylobacter]MBE2984042.1 1-deoxy-D-xylulose-5-phosphate reductoisomerase [Campylobacter sp. RM6883]MBE2995467.1 1-deoxy-D-xylulose-5-phosphate reductoisomerase [Campylobacter sp. RM6913]MBE3030281.1 1-deoxy-D-xylulose-5-phosphate reductoisomerase [Campylobacter sp. RM9344]MBE3607903.1 1-deoxy-D-xylulose-5-phosphate reductoisomerase [Campylobacter sp. RM9337]QCD51510.1 1-deoxy-D-xylulose 5-phosphate reductoisomeras
MVVLGSTGSIGTNTLLLCKRHNINVEAISCGKNVELLNEQISNFSPKFVCVGDEKLRGEVKGISKDKIFIGQEGLLDMLEVSNSKKVVNSLVGFAGLRPSLKTQKLGKKLALANKESLVVGGKFLDTSKILPIDSEHFGLKFLLENKTKPSRLIITASGGAFYKTPLKSLKMATAKDALKHPNWSMGAKITIDSATMANKLFEVMEAYWLYGIKHIEALIEPTSMIHALVEFVDGSTSAHISRADMKLAISHAVLENVDETIISHTNLLELKSIKFHNISLKKYPIFSLKEQVLDTPDIGVVINAANEVGVFAFLKNECGFLDISRIVLKAAKKFRDAKILNEDEIFKLDKEVREFAKRELNAKI